MADVFNGLDFRFLDALLRVSNQIVDQSIQDSLQGLVEPQLLGRVGIKLLHRTVEALEDGHTFADFFQRQQV